MIGGRYYGMDRDKRWERTKAWYDAMVHGIGYQTDTGPDRLEAALASAYERGENDEFVKPTLIEGVDGDVVRVRRRRHPFQLPRRPRAAADARAGGHGLRLLRPR